MTIEAPQKSYLSIATQGQTKRRNYFPKKFGYCALTMRMPMRIDVGRQSTKERLEYIKLTPKLVLHRLMVAEIELPLVLSPNVPVESNG